MRVFLQKSSDRAPDTGTEHGGHSLFPNHGSEDLSGMRRGLCLLQVMWFRGFIKLLFKKELNQNAALWITQTVEGSYLIYVRNCGVRKNKCVCFAGCWNATLKLVCWSFRVGSG